LQTYFKFLYFITFLQNFLGFAYLEFIFLNSRVKYIGLCVCVTCLVNFVLGLPASPEEEGSLLQNSACFWVLLWQWKKFWYMPLILRKICGCACQ